ncbi:hypothetical protein QE152_g8179 [Popillia japonica]|uniref:Uncharacterized protein n=1 Tax=Popillia japonica TaxID=7064 RepID=A0AAW1M515_POPJA
MEIGKVKIAEDSDFLTLKTLVDDSSNWKLDYEKGDTKVHRFLSCAQIKSSVWMVAQALPCYLGNCAHAGSILALRYEM